VYMECICVVCVYSVCVVCMCGVCVSCAGQDHPRWTGHGAEFWQNVVPWRREWKTTQYSCFENLINSIKRQKDVLGNS